jgi:hypothetical protein
MSPESVAVADARARGCTCTPTIVTHTSDPPWQLTLEHEVGCPVKGAHDGIG